MSFFAKEKHLKELREKYHEAVQAGGTSSEELKARSAEIVAAMNDLSAFIAQGATACPLFSEGTDEDGNEIPVSHGTPHGLKKRPGVFVITCLSCNDNSASGESPEEAVYNWNEKHGGN